jgi:hypothetical protein
MFQSPFTGTTLGRFFHGVALFLKIFIIHFKKEIMKDNRPNRNKDNSGHAINSGDTIGNQQRTTQTGAQNSGGENIDRGEDPYTGDFAQQWRPEKQ